MDNFQILSLLKKVFQGGEISQMDDESHFERWQEVGVDFSLSQFQVIENELVAMALMVPLRGGILNLVAAVDPKLQGQGLGSQILKNSIESLKGSEYSFIGLEVRADNAAAIRAYTKIGFRITRRLLSFRGKLELQAPTEAYRHVVGPFKALASIPYGFESREEILERHKQDFECHELFSGSTLVASCLFRPEHNALIKLEAQAPYSKHAEALLWAMKLNQEMIGIVNVDEDHSELLSFLEEKGLVRYLTQFEMRKMIL
jgi:GNAT superfamily N-acetyltransferase